MRYAIYATLLTLFITAPAAAESISINEAIEIFESVMVEPSNGHWECICHCMGLSRTIPFGENGGLRRPEVEAFIDGRCQPDYRGTSCSGEDYEAGIPFKGKLTYCYNHFVID